ncbi:hypothetical protein ACU686_39055 [Yinghuangia aomiensis]
MARNLSFIASPKALADPGKLRDTPGRRRSRSCSRNGCPARSRCSPRTPTTGRRTDAAFHDLIALPRRSSSTSTWT